jgi:hypothetical protein
VLSQDTGLLKKEYDFLVWVEGWRHKR